jgi:hypothetical protein
MKFTLAILYAPDGRRPLSVARVSDRDLLAIVAEQAVLEAEAIAARLTEDDPTLGALQREEATKLRRVLWRLVDRGPESRAASSLM